ncbi:MAG: acyltransferase, partial [Peptococcaceae bacterium]|nr:acyltransferase [Peptococcaceae bacterium]
ACDRYAEVSVLAAHLPFYVGECSRYFYYKFTLKQVGRKVVFKYGSFCQYRNTFIGNRVLIGFYNILGEVTIGDDVLLGSYVNITSGKNQHSFADVNQKINAQPALGRVMVHIGNDVWIGNNAVIAADIGSRCVVGLGSVVVKKLSSHGVYGGNPAKLIKQI